MRVLRLAGAALLAAATIGAAAVVSGAGAAAAQAKAPGPNSVQITVVKIDPPTPLAQSTPTPLTFSLQLTNTSTQTLNPVTIGAERSDPISTAKALQDAIAKPRPPTEGLASAVLAPDSKPVTVSLPPGQPVSVLVSTVSQLYPTSALCICETRIYPIYFTASWQSPDGAVQQVGSTQTYVPSFPTAPQQPAQVAWAWPLVDRPHRLSSDTVFLDDDLATSVRGGGRLYNLLEVAQDVVAQHVAFTLLLDPETVDELSVMSTGYTVQSGSSTPVQGTGGPDARNWLDGLRSVITSPDVQVVLTPYADPDVAALTYAGLPWATDMPATMQARVTAALGSLPATDVAWPAGSRIDLAGATALAGSGTHTLLLGPDAVSASDAVPAGSGRTVAISTDAGTLTALQMPASLSDGLSDVLAAGGAGLTALPTLVAQLAVPVVENPDEAHTVLLLPDRNLDPYPAAAEQAILATAKSSWARGVTVSELAAEATDPPAAELSTDPVAALDPDVLAAISSVTQDQQAVTSMIGDKESGTRFEGMAEAVQRMKSSGWAHVPDLARTAAGTLGSAVRAVTSGVRLVIPNNGNYTLGSNDSPLPITIANDNAFPVRVRLSLTTVGGLPGFHADDAEVKTVDAQTKLPVSVPVHLDRAGRIPIRVQLLAPAPTASGEPLVLGKPLALYVRSTALGEIGKIITWGAGIVLALLLFARAVRQLYKKRRRSAARAAATA